jgi:hypothetical protein
MALAKSDGAQATEKRIEQRNVTDPAAGLQVTTKPLIPCSQAPQERDRRAASRLGTSVAVSQWSFDTQKSDNVHAIDVDIGMNSNMFAERFTPISGIRTK